ncbi:SDR family oxidoreductase [Bartonella sp. DGB2]|uniref:SDR family oxidoreductase n=1 Tax=Bartonella sp. DGB2 TaxID=3388426 RepID=UPI00398FB4A1
MQRALNGRKAIICASSRGLGKACARALAENGCAVTINGRSAQALEQTAKEIREQMGVPVTTILADITSTAVYAPLPGLDLSSGVRASLTAFLAGIARMVAAQNITINNILPGPFVTGKLRENFAAAAKVSGKSINELMKKRQSENPAKRFGQPEELGHAYAFFCSEKSGFITGQNLIIDGGAYASAF